MQAGLTFFFLLVMSSSKTFATEQEAFWSGSFGDAYTDRNAGDSIVRSNLLFWGGAQTNRTDQ
jgi:hypothetical protein